MAGVVEGHAEETDQDEHAEQQMNADRDAEQAPNRERPG